MALKFDMQDALELHESARGEDIRVTLADHTHFYCQFAGYDHQTDTLDTSAGRLTRSNIINVVVLSRMDRVMNGFVTPMSELPDHEHQHGRKTSNNKNLDWVEGNSDRSDY